MRNTNSINKFKSADNFWRRRPSEIKGYNRTIYTTTENNEYLRVDFNLKEKRIRLYIEDNEEGGNPYYSVIINGKVTVERNATTGRTADLYLKFSKRADILSTIPNKDVVRLINGNYGIGVKGGKLARKEEAKNIIEQRIKEREQLRKNQYVSNLENETERVPVVRGGKEKSHFIDIIDTLIGLILCIAIYLYNHNFVTLGVLSAFIGIFIGLLDAYYRERHLILIKMLLFLLAGIVFYVYGYYIL